MKTTIKTTTSPLIEKNNQEETQVFNALQKTDKSILKMLEESFLKKGANFHKKYTVNILKKGGGFKNPILLDSSSGGGLSFLKNVHPDLFFKLSNWQEKPSAIEDIKKNSAKNLKMFYKYNNIAI